MDMTQAHFRDDEAARTYFEAIRWPDGRVCPHCGVIGEEYKTKRAGRYRCGVRLCRKDFTTTTGTVMESSKVGLAKWLWVFAMMTASKKGISSQQVRLLLLVLTKTAESSGNAAQTVDGWRVGLLKGFEDSGDPADQSRRLVTDHADYLLALVELQLRRKAARG